MVRFNRRKRPHIACVRACVCAIILVGAHGVSALAGPFSQLVVFGDSLSDVGNVAQATESIPFIDSIPGPYYHEGRFSNGPVHSELLTRGLGLPALVHSRSDGTNFAHGGAKTSGTAFPESIVVLDVDDQVTEFLAGPAADPEALFVVFAGANDALDLQKNMSTAANQLTTDIGRLIADGARHLLLFNLPLMGYTPRFNSDPSEFDLYNSRSAQFNLALATGVVSLRSMHPLVELFEFDVAALFGDAIADPTAYGLTNVTNAAAPGLQPGDSSYNTSLIAPNAHEYMFWDDLHPTTTVHAALAEEALTLLADGDYNWDGEVNAADYVALRKGIDISYSADHYASWRGNFGTGETFYNVGHAGATVPEPTVWTWLLAGAIIRAPGRRVRLQ
jgi:phospholipase/lecithinase/hemolysin